MITSRHRHRLCFTACTAFTALAIAANAQAAGPDLLSRELCREAVPQVAKAFAGVLAPVRRAGHCLAGDFTGDGRPDVLMVVKVLVAGPPPAAVAKTIYPFHDRQAGGKGRLQLLALHSNARSVSAEWPLQDRLLLDGDSSVMVLRHEEIASDMERVTQRSKEVVELQVPRRAMRGEAVYLGTEAVSAILYWNGKTWVFHEDPAGP